VKRFKTVGTTYKLNFGSAEILEDDVRRAFAEVIETAQQNSKPTDLFGLKVEHVAFKQPILIPFCSRDKFLPFNLMNVIDAVRQSYVNVNYSTEMCLTFTRISK